MNKTVCVTGASGFLGSHVVSELLSRHFNVIAMVRNPDGEGSRYLQRMVSVNQTEISGGFEVMQADFMQPGSYDEAFSRSDYLIHTAADISSSYEKPSDALLENTYDNITGAINVIDSIKRSSRIKRIIYTSSMAAVLRSDVTSEHIYNENDWNNDAKDDSDKYYFSKTQAERMFAEQFDSPMHQQYPELIRFNPSVLLGNFHVSSHQNTSIAIVRNLLKSGASACPELYYSVVDVRDVARIYVDAITNEHAAGRYLVPGESVSILGMAEIIAEYFPEHKMPRRELKAAHVYAFAEHSRELTKEYLDKFLGVEYQFSDAKLLRDFKIDFTPIEKTIRDTVDAIERFDPK